MNLRQKGGGSVKTKHENLDPALAFLFGRYYLGRTGQELLNGKTGFWSLLSWPITLVCTLLKMNDDRHLQQKWLPLCGLPPDFLEAPELLAEALAGGARRRRRGSTPAPRPGGAGRALCAAARAGAGRASPGSRVRPSRP